MFSEYGLQVMIMTKWASVEFTIYAWVSPSSSGTSRFCSLEIQFA